MDRLEHHPAADLFPMMGDDRYAELRESIRAGGLINAIVTYEGKILDGRNRYKACLELGVTPSFREHKGNPFDLAWNVNGNRRDLATDQRAVIYVMASKLSAEWKALHDAVAAEANRKRSEAAAARPRNEDGTLASSPASTCGGTGSDAQPSKPKRDAKAENEKKSATAKAKASGTNRAAIERATKLVAERPDLAEKVAKGEVKPTQAQRQLKRDKIASRIEPFPEGKYRVIYADPPWKYNDSREGLGAGDGVSGGVDRASTAANDHYPTMSKSELMALDVKGLADTDAVLFCWATFPLLDDQLEVVASWGFQYKTAFVWDKGSGSFGNYHNCCAELLLVCTRGSCTPDQVEKERQVQFFPRGKHSAKPEDWRVLIDRMYPHGPRVELFRRGKAPDGWHVWGNQAVQAEAAE